MKIAIICSLDFPNEVKRIKNDLEKAGHEVNLPFTLARIINDEISLEDIKNQKEAGDLHKFTTQENLIKRNYDRIKDSDAVLTINIEKKGVPNYIGGNTFLEIGFAFVLDKKIFIWNDLPDMLYTDELMAMSPIIINQDISKLA